MKRRLVKTFTATLLAVTVLVGPAVAGGGPVASARAICHIVHGHCARH
ncbi:MAG: hypothetical protein M3O84_09370 [Actinomycetota bacterium]|nr:hypothetical protein [Actinomycetota bacterium]